MLAELCALACALSVFSIPEYFEHLSHSFRRLKHMMVMDNEGPSTDRKWAFKGGEGNISNPS